MNRLALLLLIFVWVVSLSPALAEEEGTSVFRVGRGKVLEIGMNYQDVTQAFGDPVEKMEYESKREEVWKYPEAEIRFSKGRIKGVVLSGEILQENSKPMSPLDALLAEAPAGAGASGDASTVEDILTEIMLTEDGGSKKSAKK